MNFAPYLKTDDFSPEKSGVQSTSLTSFDTYENDAYGIKMENPSQVDLEYGLNLLLQTDNT